ncbi:hypothetical protein [Actinomadura parmotrematis]|uniref:CBM6 domain-containing protein n=1 Tax=Actinomadura parmotrematis TaxID=2864039 RepID=A0ABS7G1H0_9ACTN|nr:hypothetical protein [Actinomadura parmotrematis]MBW8486512.1 hypothetical protein [Actinomadura parmotrematis]
MKSARRPGGKRPVPGRVTGYGSALVLVALAVAVLLTPLLGKDSGGDRKAAAGRPTAPAAQTGLPGLAGGAPGAAPTGTAPAAGRSTAPVTGQNGQNGQGGAGAGAGGGPQVVPSQNSGGAGATWCPAGTAIYQGVPGGVDLVINVSASGAVRADLTRNGGASAISRSATVNGGTPHTFHFTGVRPADVSRVKITTVSIAAASTTCYARPA